MKHSLIFACLLVLSCSGNETAGAANDAHALAINRPETRTAITMQISAPGFTAGGTIPIHFSAYGKGISPAINWAGAPAETKSLVLFMEDPDAVSAKPYVHWLAWNIDPSSGGLPEAIPPGPAPGFPPDIRQGRNTRGTFGYFGPRPHGTKPHHYHFQLFALDTKISLDAGSKREDILKAINGHVLAKGDLIGLFRQP